MKKICILLMILLLLCGCGSNPKEESVQDEMIDVASLNIVTPKGAPVLAFYDQIANDNYVRVDASAISALWTGEESPEVITVDLTSGLSAIRNGAPYQLAAIITFGNLYIGSTGNDENDTMDADDRIVLFGNENMLPSKVFHYLYEDTYDEAIVYVSDAQQAAACLVKGADLEGNPVDYVFLAQPAMFAAMKQNENASIHVDIQEAYKNKSGLDLIQAAVFIRDSVNDATAEAFLSNLENSITAAIENPDLLSEGLSIYEGDEAIAQYGFNPAVVVNVFKQKNALGINAMGLGYARAKDIKSDIDAFLNVMGLEETSEEIYR